MKNQSDFQHPQSKAFLDSSFEMEGRVVELLRGCGTAVIAGEQQELTINRGTDGVHFEQLSLGQNVVCTVTGRNKRVLHARQQPIAENASARDLGNTLNQTRTQRTTMKSNHSETAAPQTPQDNAPTGTGNMFPPSHGAAPVDPWQEFLCARTRVVEWLVREYNWTDALISRQLSLSPGQVQQMRPAGTSHARSGGADTDVTIAAPLDN